MLTATDCKNQKGQPRLVDNDVAAFLTQIPWRQSACQRGVLLSGTNSVFSLQFRDSRFPVSGILYREASSVVGLEKHEKFKQGDSADNEDELCFVCYKNCKWQAIHHSFGFQAYSDWMPFWLADWLTDWMSDVHIDWPTRRRSWQTSRLRSFFVVAKTILWPATLSRANTLAIWCI